MANGRFLGVQATKIAAAIPTLAEQGLYGGKARKMIDTYVLTADLAAGDQIKMGELLPTGSTVTGCKVATGALGGSCTIDVGWLASDDGTEAAVTTAFFNTLAVSTAVQASAFGHAQGGTFYLHKFVAPVQPVVSEHAVSSSATGLSISIEIDYFVD